MAAGSVFVRAAGGPELLVERPGGGVGHGPAVVFYSLPPSPQQHQSTFRLDGFPCPEHFLYTESQSMRLSVASSDLARRPPGHPQARVSTRDQVIFGHVDEPHYVPPGRS